MPVLMVSPELCFLTAVEQAGSLRRRELTAVELMEAHIRQVERLNPHVNAMVTFLPEQALAEARAADAALARGELGGPLAGLPVAHKDLFATRGVRTTYGSPLYRDVVPNEDALIVGRTRAAGGIMLGKTNTPEFGAGSQTFNSVFGATRNPYDLTRTCGGSSGGAAVALACGMAALASGSDLGGSLRNPAGFCNVVGFRTSPGRVPVYPSAIPWSPFSIHGPMARTVEDVALFLTAIAGPDPRSPISLDEAGTAFDRPLGRDFKGAHIAWSPDLGGLPVEPQVAAALQACLPVFEQLGCVIEQVSPDFAGAEEAFHTWRAWQYETAYGALLDQHRELLKGTVIEEIEAGRRLTGPQLGRAEARHRELYQRLRQFMEGYEFLLCPVTQVLPFSVDQEWVMAINGQPMEGYIDWMRSCWYISAAGLPAISVPAGFSPEGLPVGLQIVGRHHADFAVLQLAHAFQQASQHWQRRPPLTPA